MMLAATALACQRGDALLFRNVGFSLEAGQALLIRGANGSGKTSLMRILAGVATPHDGAVTWEGSDDVASRRAALTYLGHTAPLKDDLTVTENLAFALALDGVSADSAAQMEAIQFAGLARRLHLPVRHLSQGQRRRIGLARLKLAGRRLWLLDEPAAALDADGLSLFCAEVDRHLAAGGIAVLSTHQPLALTAAVKALQL